MVCNSQSSRRFEVFALMVITIAVLFLNSQRLWAMGKAGKEVWLSDMSKCLPADAISLDVEPKKWIAVNYEVQEGKGVMVFALPSSKAPPITLKLNASGWYEVRLGIFYGAHAGYVEDRYLCAKLSNDGGFSRFAREPFRADKDGSFPEKKHGWSDIVEVFWKCADLTGQDLIIKPPGKGQMGQKESNLAYVRLVPMASSAVKEWEAEQPREKTKLLIANYDGGSFGQWGISSRQDFLNEFESLRDSDFDIALYAMAYGPITFYPSKVGEFARPIEFYGPRMSASGPVWMRKCVENGLDPLAEAIRAAHACGVKLFVQNRFSGPQIPPNHVRIDHGGKFMADHPEWMSRYPDGEPTRHLSFAYKGVRDFYVRLFREWVEDYRADGINMLFSRSYPFVYYEQPVLDAFEKKYGEDMRKVDVWDKRAQQVRAQFMTQFLREVRAMLDEVGKAQDRYIPNCYLVPVQNSPSNFWRGKVPASDTAVGECLFNALDVATWISEGLVDYLSVHLHVYHPHDGREFQQRIREFTELAKGSKTKVFIDIYPRRMPPRQYRKIAMSYYAAGADGLAFWDSYNRYYRASEWAFIKRLGHRDQLEGWKGKGDDYFRVVPLKRLDGFVTGREFSKPSDG